jgi:spermidine/putrescine transport system permease protein
VSATGTLDRPTAPPSPPAAPRRRNRKRIRPGTIALWVIAIGGLIYLFVPLVTIAVFTFNHPTGKFNTTWEGFTWDNWLHPFSQKAFTDALWQSIKVAAVACTLATVLGSLIALALARYRIHGGTVINLLIVLPLTTPEIVMGASLFTLFFNQGVERGFWTIVIAHTMFCLSFVALTVKARIRGSDWTLEDAAMDLGSSPMRTFWKITMPIITPGVIAAFLLSLALSIDDYIITSFVAGPTITFPRRIFDSARIALPPQVHVLATIIMLVAIAIIVGATVAGNRRRT